MNVYVKGKKVKKWTYLLFCASHKVIKSYSLNAFDKCMWKVSEFKFTAMHVYVKNQWT